jgi:ABC-type polysaccharide/polyol phosphate transport system ATPase subunit
MKRSRKKTPVTQKELPAISIQDATKYYILHHSKPTLIERFFDKSETEKFHALKDVNITVHKGEKVAIIGKNGSGKTTLLKMICGITRQNSGKVKIRGRVVSLIDLEAGFHPEMNGYENIMLNALVIGMARDEIHKNMQDIVDFAGIGSFIDAPLYTYSEGMKLRLGFSVAVHANPDILVLDEMIATGDAGFQKKCVAKINQFFKEGKTIITVSHNILFLEENYDRFIWLDNGQVREDGGLEVMESYKRYWNI